MNYVTLALSLLYVIVFPGFFFLFGMALFTNYFDRKLYARMQKRVGPPFLQPVADLVKLLSKEDLVPKAAERGMFNAVPLFAFAAVATAFLYIPTFYQTSIMSFQGDLIMVLFLLTVPSFVMFLAGYYSSNTFGQVGAVRAMTQLFAYEVPFLLALLAPAVVAGSWGMADIVGWQIDHFWVLILAPVALAVGIVTLQGKVARIPFDIPEAETEIVDGPLAEYSGKRLALFKLAMDMELVVGSALIAALFLGGPTLFFGLDELGDVGGFHLAGYAVGFLVFLVKTLFVIVISTFIRTSMARIRIDQLVNLCYKYLAPLAVVQLMVIVLVKYVGWI